MKRLTRNILAPLLGLAVLAVAPLSAFAQSKENPEALFVKQKDSIFLIKQSIFVNAQKIGDLDLFKKLEEAMGQPVLNQYIPVVYGTGFLVNQDGSLITAAHVVQYLPKDQKEESGYWSFINYCFKYMLPGHVSSMEFTRIVADYKKRY